MELEAHVEPAEEVEPAQDDGSGTYCTYSLHGVAVISLDCGHMSICQDSPQGNLGQ